MIKWLICAVLMVTCAFRCWSQNPRLGNWNFGWGEGLDFTTYPPTKTTSKAQTSEGVTGISDTNGNLACYFYSGKLYNGKHQLVTNSMDIKSCLDLCQTGIIVPKPASNNEYYLFHFDINPRSGYPDLYYSTIDMDMNGGQGGLSAKNNLLTQTISLGIAATHHANKDEVWVVVKDAQNADYQSFQCTPLGVNQPVISKLSNKEQYYAKFSPTGDHYASWQTDLAFANDQLTILNFDKLTGRFTEHLEVKSCYSYSFAFSPNGGMLYYVDANNLIIQLELATWSSTPLGSHHFSAMQLASDGRIYTSGATRDKLWVIESPNSKGAACSLSVLDVQFANFFYHFPTFIESNPVCKPATPLIVHE